MSILNGSILTLYGTVGSFAFDDAFTAKDVRDALDEHGRGNIVVNLNSGGGLALEGLAIFNALKNHPGRITVNIDAIAASAASLIAMAGDEIVMREGALMMVHDPRAMAAGTASDLRKSASALDTMAEQFRRIYASRTGQKEPAVGSLMADETWMDAAMAESLGFATRQSAQKAAEITAFDYSIYRNPPAELAGLNGKTIFMTTEIDTAKPKNWAAAFYASAGQTGLALADLNNIVEASATVDAAKDALITMMADKRNANLPSPTGARANYGSDATFNNPEFLTKVAGDALYARMSGTAPEGAAQELMGRSLLDIGAALLQARGQKVSYSSRSSLADRVLMSGGSHSTSDFPGLLTNTGNRVLLYAYAQAESPLKTLAKRKDTPDFRPLSSLRLSEMPSLDPVEEGGEINYGSRSESQESFRVRPFGKIFGLTREAIVNDDLGAFSDSAVAWGRAAASREAAELTALFLANSGDGVGLSDGAPVYATSRGNKAAIGAALNVASIGAARQALRQMVGLDGKTPLGITPKHLVVGPAKETEAEQLLHQLSATQVSGVNPFAGKLTLHVEPRFTGNAWRIFADPSEIATIVIAYLNGTNGPVLATREGWNTLGIEFRAVLDFGCGIESAKGTYLNPGA